MYRYCISNNCICIHIVDPIYVAMSRYIYIYIYSVYLPVVQPLSARYPVLERLVKAATAPSVWRLPGQFGDCRGEWTGAGDLQYSYG